MMGEKHYLHELLKENQEPFLLNKYISDRRSQMIKSSSSHQNYYSTNIKQPIINSSNLFTICKNSSSCLFSFPETPDNITKSPVLFQKSPCKSPNKIFLHINSRTASLLLEAALRIQKDSASTSTLKTKTKTKGFGLFGSLFKRLTQRNRNDKDKMDSEPEKKEMETSCSGQFYDSEEIIHFVTNHQDSVSCQSPFRFVLQTTSCSGTHTPELASPSRHVTEEDKESKRAEESSAKQLKRGEELDKEQFSPVCVLEPPFEDDDDEEAHGNEDDGDPDLESSYAIVQRARQQILYKLRRFEKLAELDPVELEKRMQQDEEEDDYENEEEEEEDMETSIEENEFPEAVFTSSTVLHHDEKQQIPQEFKKLISDLIMEEEKELNNCSEDREMVMSRICKRLELWKEVECNTIDMMIEEDFCREDDVGWRKKNVEQITEMAGEVEIAIFGFLVEELVVS